jgi:DNA-binding NarL/FixJ family response regulator
MTDIRVAIVEDDSRIRRLLQQVFGTAPGFQCVGALADGRSAIAQVPMLKPDVLIMDINLPDVGGVECVKQLSPRLPETQIIMLTVYQDPETIFQALAAGAHGYLAKPVMPDKLIEAIREIRAGGGAMSPVIARKVMDAFRLRPAAPAKPPPDEPALGPREQQVLEFVVAGFAYKEIANELGLKWQTVATYVQRIYEKLHVRSRREVVAHYQGTRRQ